MALDRDIQLMARADVVAALGDLGAGAQASDDTKQLKERLQVERDTQAAANAENINTAAVTQATEESTHEPKKTKGAGLGAIFLRPSIVHPITQECLELLGKPQLKAPVSAEGIPHGALDSLRALIDLVARTKNHMSLDKSPAINMASLQQAVRAEMPKVTAAQEVSSVFQVFDIATQLPESQLVPADPASKPNETLIRQVAVVQKALSGYLSEWPRTSPGPGIAWPQDFDEEEQTDLEEYVRAWIYNKDNGIDRSLAEQSIDTTKKAVFSMQEDSEFPVEDAKTDHILEAVFRDMCKEAYRFLKLCEEAGEARRAQQLRGIDNGEAGMKS